MVYNMYIHLSLNIYILWICHLLSDPFSVVVFMRTLTPAIRYIVYMSDITILKFV